MDLIRLIYILVDQFLSAKLVFLYVYEFSCSLFDAMLFSIAIDESRPLKQSTIVIFEPEAIAKPISGLAYLIRSIRPDQSVKAVFLAFKELRLIESLVSDTASDEAMRLQSCPIDSTLASPSVMVSPVVPLQVSI